MAKQHEHAEAFVSFLNTTQQAYETRRLDDYISAFAADYCTVQLHSVFHEDLAQLRAKIAADMEKYELLSMDFRMLDDWYTGEIGYAHMSYVTRLRFRDSGRVLIDERENLIVGAHQGDGRWEIKAKITINARNYFESETQPEI